jgi:hypothetical protein
VSESILKKKRLTRRDIDLYCRSVEEVLAQINNRVSLKKKNVEKRKELTEDELLTLY